MAAPHRFFFGPIIGRSSITIHRSANAEALPANVFDYAIFSGDPNEPLNISAQHVWVTGNVHSNASINITDVGQNNYIDSTTEAVGEISVSNQCDTTKVSDAENMPMPDLSGEVQAIERNFGGQTIYGNYTIDSNNDTVDGGVLYVYGNVYITTNNIKGAYGSIIYATGNIDITANNIQNANHIMFYSSGGNIIISSNNIDGGNGIFYAPNGTIEFTGNGGSGTLNNVDLGDGAIVGKDISLSVNTITISSTDTSKYNLPRTAYLSN